MAKLVVRVPERLKKRIEEEAEDVDMLPSELVRELLRRAFDGKKAIEELDEAEPDE